MRRLTWLWVGTVTLAVLLATPHIVSAQEEETEPFSVNWESMDIEQVIRLVAALTHKKIVFDETVRGRKVNVVADEPVPRSMVFPIFQTVLKSQGFIITEQTIKDNGNEETLWRVVFGQQMQGIPSELVEEGEPLPKRDVLVTKIFSLRYINAQEAQASIRDLVSFPKNVFTLEQVNKVVVTDVAPVVDKISKILEILDQPAPDVLLVVIPLEHADAEDLAQRLQAPMQQLAQAGISPGRGGPVPGGGRQRQEVVSITADPRTNSLIVIATESRMEQIRSLIADLDVEVQYREIIVHIFKLIHINAAEFAEKLTTFYQGVQAQQQEQQQGQAVVPGAGRAGGRLPPSIVADEQNNALIVSADPETFEQIEQIVRESDIWRRQVHIKCIVAEINYRDMVRLQAEIMSFGEAKDRRDREFGATNFGLGTLLDNDSDGIPDIRTTTITQPSVLLGITQGPEEFPLLIEMLATNTSLNVLTEPEVVTQDNTTAKMETKEQEPVIKLERDSTGDVVTRAFDHYEEAAISLNITPHISEEKFLRLEINQKVETFSTRPADLPEEAPPPKNTREVDCSVVIPDGSTVVIGGLTLRSDMSEERGIPLLKDIPVLGHLFKSQTDRENKTLLYIFVTATIMADERFNTYLNLSTTHQEDVNRDTEGKHWPGKQPEFETPTSALDVFEYQSPFSDER